LIEAIGASRVAHASREAPRRRGPAIATGETYMSTFIVPSVRLLRSIELRSLVFIASVCAAAASSARAQIKLHTLYGDAAGDSLGTSLRTIGDVNGDGIPDFVAGAPHPVPQYGIGAGEAIVFSGADGSVLYRFHGTLAIGGDFFGQYVDGAGDVNGDGVPDIIVGSTYITANDTTGNAMVFSGATGGVLYTFFDEVNPEPFPSPVAGVGDVNGDGYADVLVAQEEAVGANGRARVYSGRDGSILYEYVGTAGEHLGSSVAAAGDVDGDGRPDFMVGAWTPYHAHVYVYSGANGNLLYSLASTSTTIAPGDGFGLSLAGVGDVNGDGHADLIVGASFESAIASNAGAAYVYSGHDGSLLHTFRGTVAYSELGECVAAGGDYDGDGRPDILVSLKNDPGAPSMSGSAYLYSGRDFHVLRKLTSQISTDGFGIAVDRLGDVNGDGKLDYIGGGYRNSQSSSASGAVYVMSLEGLYSNYCSATANSSGGPAMIHGQGYATVSNNDLVLSVTQLPLHSSGLFIASTMQGSSPLGNGNLCLSGSIIRIQPALNSGSTGTVSRSVPAQLAGQTWNYQYWFRDIPAGGAGTNLSDGLQVTFMP
jgi:hypothetical protein